MKQTHWIALLLLLLTLWAGWHWVSIHRRSNGGETPSASADLDSYPWVYQRPGNLVEDGPGFEIIVVGDVLAGRQGNSLKDLSIPPEFQSADLLLGNLEGMLADLEIAADPDRLPYQLAGAPEAAQRFATAGFDLFSLANNHALDLGEQGLQLTAQHLERAGIAWVGAGKDAEEAGKARIWRANTLRVAIFAANAIPLPSQRAAEVGWQPAEWGASLLNRIRDARQHVDILLVLIHWGYEYQSQVDPVQSAIAQDLLEAGADLVIGSHPHIVQKVEVHSEPGHLTPQIVAYSLGNFLFDQGAPENHDGLALRVILDAKGIRGVQALPIQAGLKPKLLPPGLAQAILSQFPSQSQCVIRCDENPCRMLEATDLSKQQVTGGLFYSGQADLTGDGLGELIRREKGQVIVYQAGDEVWRTPEEWQILDAALGDPDWDGRNDIVLALLKLDENQVWRSHPFIMGYRGGVYRNLWGGSAVSDPILELELGNVDDTPQPELIVLEERDSGKRAVTIWDWHGWGFSLRWRSAEGNYQNVRLAQGAPDVPHWIVVDQCYPSPESLDQP